MLCVQRFGAKGTLKWFGSNGLVRRELVVSGREWFVREGQDRCWSTPRPDVYMKCVGDIGVLYLLEGSVMNLRLTLSVMGCIFITKFWCDETILLTLGKLCGGRKINCKSLHYSNTHLSFWGCLRSPSWYSGNACALGVLGYPSARVRILAMVWVEIGHPLGVTASKWVGFQIR